MKRTKWLYLAAFALAAAVLVLRLLLFIRMTKTDTPSAPSASPAPVSAAARPLPAAAKDILFPGLNQQSITSITVSTPDRSFHFRCEDPQSISVNGQRADREIFRTLIEQISQFPVDMHASFAPSAQDLLLTLVISSGAHQQTARFYEDSDQREMARIVLGSDDAPQYRQTSGWRVGTLMMLCEGTRMLDAHGNEQPVIR